MYFCLAQLFPLLIVTLEPDPACSSINQIHLTISLFWIKLAGAVCACRFDSTAFNDHFRELCIQIKNAWEDGSLRSCLV